MSRELFFGASTALSAVVSLAFVSGCGSGATAPRPGASADAAHGSDAGHAEGGRADAGHDGGGQGGGDGHDGGHGDGGHAHKPGEHGGIIVSIGRDSYHAEAVFEQGGTLRLFLLGQDESRVQEADSQPLTAYVKASGGSDSKSITLDPQPQPGDADGMTSQFVGKLPEDLAGRPAEVTIPSLRIGGERFRLGFESATPGHAGDGHGGDGHAADGHAGGGMPDKVADAAERELYLTPGGHYTVADIEANGTVTASQKFKGVPAKHDMKPKPGDKICPITMTKANPKFGWVVGGKTYEFCCPPCVDEFVAQAKAGGEIGEPEDYVKGAGGAGPSGGAKPSGDGATGDVPEPPVAAES